MSYENENEEIEPDASEFDAKHQRSIIDTLELVLDLSNKNKGKQVIASLKYSFFPFAGFCMNVADEKGVVLQNEYQKWFYKAKQYVESNSGITKKVDTPVKPDSKIEPASQD